MKANSPKRKDQRVTLELHPSDTLCEILNDFRKRFMPDPESNSATAAAALLQVALIDYDQTMARLRQIEVYCIAEGIQDQGEYRESILRAKFPRGRVPRPKAAW
jgi:hypothetical protein